MTQKYGDGGTTPSEFRSNNDEPHGGSIDHGQLAELRQIAQDCGLTELDCCSSDMVCGTKPPVVCQLKAMPRVLGLRAAINDEARGQILEDAGARRAARQDRDL